MKVFSIVLLLFTAFISYQPYSYGSNASSMQRAEMNNLALKRSLDYGGANEMQVTKLLSSHDFQSLEKWYEDMFQHYKMDEQYEQYLQTAYELFRTQKAKKLADLDLWVNTTESYIAYAARGLYKAQQGTYYETENRARLHDEASKDLRIAIKKNPALMPAYKWLMIIARQSKSAYTPKQVLQQAIENDDRTLLVRAQYMVFLKPRGGGSYQEMNAFAKEMIKHVDSNSRLWSLQGEADADRADTYYEERNYDLAIKSYIAALKFGDRVEWLKRRAECYEKLSSKDKSPADYEKVRQYDSRDSAVIVRSAPANISAFNFELKENSYIDPNLSKYHVQSYVVLPVEHHVQWLNERGSQSEGVVKRNIDKIELMIMRLGKDCVERSKLDAILQEQKLSLTGLTNEKAQYVGKLINADAVIITSIPAMGMYHTESMFFEDIDIKAVSVSTGKILWKSLLKGSVIADKNKHADGLVLDVIETRLYELLESKLKNN